MPPSTESRKLLEDLRREVHELRVEVEALEHWVKAYCPPPPTVTAIRIVFTPPS
jgi:hypothetical protein